MQCIGFPSLLPAEYRLSLPVLPRNAIAQQCLLKDFAVQNRPDLLKYQQKKNLNHSTSSSAAKTKIYSTGKPTQNTIDPECALLHA